MATVCSHCTHLFVPEGARAAWWKWLCVANKIPKTFNPITGRDDLYAPYKQCKRVNDGSCPDFDAGPTILHPRADENGVTT